LKSYILVESKKSIHWIIVGLKLIVLWIFVFTYFLKKKVFSLEKSFKGSILLFF